LATAAKMMHHFTTPLLAIPSKLPAKIGKVAFSKWYGTPRRISPRFALKVVAVSGF
jgi:hypothetical protein